MEFAALIRSPNGKRIVLHGLALAATCIAISVFYGSAVVGGPVLYGLGFATYGGFGYIALGLAVFFFVALHDRLAVFPEQPKFEPAPIALGLAAAFIFWRAVLSLNSSPTLIIQHQLLLGVAMHLLFWLGFGLLGYGFFGRNFVREFLREFRKPLLACVLIGVVLYACMTIVWRAWPILSYGVSRLVYLLAQVFPGDATLIPPMTLRVHGFGVLIGEACSGVFSIFLFSALFGLLIARDWRYVVPWRAGVLFALALAGLFLVNVLRVYLIILVGALYDPDLAVGLFHSYVGTVLFLVFFILFLWYCSDWMHKPRNAVTISGTEPAAATKISVLARVKRASTVKQSKKKTRSKPGRRARI